MKILFQFRRGFVGGFDDDDDEDKISLLQRQIEASPYTYENHVKLISVCRKKKEYEELFAARERMSELFPMTPELWIDWINDERKVGSSKLDLRTRLNSLYERALKDYPSVSIWSEYGSSPLALLEIHSKCDLDRVREIFERAITSVGIHVVQGSLIWESFRELEVYWLIQLKNNETASKKLETKNKVFGLFKRQLSVPLLGKFYSLIN
ncbi:squamous cell carcinoma antigen recognized by T-cells 3 [Caerostris extrusa]|uniref:Squamous cell carcinoma antigen recognized by T-cells 3 n=1 Tax=Caerostris extrusa TaxID=172846 RepID=A0AAV4W5E1_CAEEX|nr:squamous cell carcinoma antigen recognized by T-cells 3 [Caerostris extrusa]